MPYQEIYTAIKVLCLAVPYIAILLKLRIGSTYGLKDNPNYAALEVPQWYFVFLEVYCMVITIIFNLCNTSSVQHALQLTWKFSGGPGNKNQYCLLLVSGRERRDLSASQFSLGKTSNGEPFKKTQFGKYLGSERNTLLSVKFEG